MLLTVDRLKDAPWPHDSIDEFLLMPRMTGFDVLRELRQDERVKDTPVLAMSGVYKENILEFLHQLGASGFLDKQQLTDSLVFRVQALLAPAAS